jgi:3-hydroxyacyl-CoA dehydrogenase/enoyl-CoA hydratase/3-hydroxybutyryl-CoA epimerase
MNSAFQLQLEDGLATLTFDLPGKKVNVFTRQALAELERLVEELPSRREIECLVLLSGKSRNFVAGADIEEIAGVTEPKEASDGALYGQRLFRSWAGLPFPTVAAIQGTCLGGGTELALSSDYILISNRADIKIGLPEIRIGIVPAWGGCSRLPGRVGVMAALDMILAGKAVNPAKAFKIGLADALLPDGNFLYQVRKFAAQIVAGDPPTSKNGDLKTALIEKNPIGRRIVFNQARKKVLESTGGHYPAPLRAIEVIEIGVRKGLEAGLAAEARATGELAVSPVSKNLIHIFHLMEDNKRELSEATPESVDFAAVIGAGVMGGGIAQLISQKADIPIRLKDLGPEPLASGMGHAASLFQKLIKRRRLKKPDAEKKMALIEPTTTYEGFSRTDLVIEAIVEDLAVKQAVFAELATHVREDTVLASNTSSLSIDRIGKETPEPERVVGMHFFNPVHKMPLVEVVRGPKTSKLAVSTVAAFAKTLGKTPIVVQDGPGFLVNRLLTFYLAEALWLLDDGNSVEQIDDVMTAWGMPMGPLELIDEIGIDVAVKVSRIMAEAVGDRLPLPAWVDRLEDTNRLGKKSGLGIYTYDKGKRGNPDKAIYDQAGLPEPAHKSDPGQMVDRLVLPMVNEGSRCLDERIVAKAGDLDLAMIMGTGFPPFRGGLCRWADQQGLETVEAELVHLADAVGDRFKPSKALQRAALKGSLYALYP